LKLIKLAAVFPALLLAGCHEQPRALPSQALVLPPSAVRGLGIDMATDSSDVLNELEEARVEFVARYYRDPDSRWPALSPGEAQRLSSRGLKIVAVYEYHFPERAHFTYEGGYYDALTAYSEARGVGQPVGSAIYFAADFHARDDDLASVVNYFRGVNAGLTTAGSGTKGYVVGVYGSGPVCGAVREAGLARYSWLADSITWDNGTDYEDWNIMQGASLPELSFNNDSDQTRSDYGAFQVVPSTPTVMSVSGPTAVTSVSGPTAVTSVPGPTAVTSVPGPTAAISVPGPTAVTSVPGPTAAISVPGPTAVTSVPRPTAVMSVPGPTTASNSE
jgi:hypothetical protein